MDRRGGTTAAAPTRGRYAPTRRATARPQPTGAAHRRSLARLVAVMTCALAACSGTPVLEQVAGPPTTQDATDQQAEQADGGTATTTPATTPGTAAVPTSSTTTPTGDTSTWRPEPPCTVSELLVPSCGAWLGASTPSADATYDYARGLAEYEAVAQNPPDILHFYKKDAVAFPSAGEVALAERPGRQRSILFYNWKPSSDLSWRAVADGGADAAIETVAAGLRQYPRKLFLAVWHEPENDQRTKGTPEDYVAMYRHVVTRLRDLGVTNAVYVMNYMGFSQWADVVDAFYPGDDVVDWIAYDPYGFGDHGDLAEVLDAASGPWPGFYSWATARAPDKPIMLAEWGIDLDRQPRAAEILDGGVEILQQRFPRIKALVYWNDHMPPDGVLVRLDQPGELGTAYAAAYRRFAGDPYFNSTDPDLAG